MPELCYTATYAPGFNSGELTVQNSIRAMHGYV